MKKWLLVAGATILLFAFMVPLSGSSCSESSDGNASSVFVTREEWTDWQEEWDEWLVEFTNWQESFSGASGPQGADGVDGVGISDVQINPDGELIVTLTNGTSINAGYVGGGSVVPPPVTGQVTVVFDASTPMAAALSTTSLTVIPFAVKVTNGTSSLQYVSYCITLTPMTAAKLVGTPALLISGALYGMTSYPLVLTPVPSLPTVSQLIFTFSLVAPVTPRIPVLPGETVTIYNSLTLQNDASTPIIYWQGSITGVTGIGTP